MSIVYWAVLAATVIFGGMADAFPKTRIGRNGRVYLRPEPVSVLLLALILISVSGFRYQVGTDFMAYYHWTVDDWSEIFKSIVSLQNGGFGLLAKLCRLVFDHDQTLIFVSACITIGLYVLTIYRISPSFLLSMLFYLFLGQWQGGFNGIRQYLAAAILFAGHRLILEKKLWQYILVVVAATMFHFSAAVMIIPYFLLNRKADVTQLVLLAIGAIVIRFSYDFIFSVIGSIKDKTMDLDRVYLSASVSIFRILVAFVPVILYLVLCRKDNLNREQNFYMNTLFFHAFSMLAGMGSTYFGRIGIYTGAAVTVGYVHLFRLIEDERSRNITVYAVLVGLFLYWIYSVYAGGIGNFQWIFNNL